jgi:predicted dehydrogenase
MLINRILIVGHGSIGKRHLQLARNLFPDADIRVLMHLKSTSTPDNSNGCFDNIEDVHSFAPQLAVIANPATFHTAVALKLTEWGVHLLIEKPIAVSQESIQLLLDLSRKNNTVLLVGYNLRFLSSLQEFRSALHLQKIGKVLSVRCEVGQFLPSWRPNTDYRQGVSARSKLGGGVLLELSHEIDYLRWIFGEVEWVTAILSQQSDLDIDVEDTAHLIFGFTAKIEDRIQLIASVNLDFIRRDITRLCTAIGDQGSLRWDGLAGTIGQFDLESKTWVEVFRDEEKDSYASEWKHFLKCISGYEKPLISGNDGLKVLEVIEAARQSSLDKEQVKVVYEKSKE